MIRVMARWGIGPTWCEERSNRSRKGKAYERRKGGDGKGEFDRCERQRAEDAAAPSSCQRRTYSGRFPNVRPGSGNHRGGAPGNPTTTQSRGWERTSKGAYEECPRLGVPSEAYFVRTTARGSLGTFHPWKVPRPGAKYPPAFSESRDHWTGKRQTLSGTPGRRTLQRAATWGGPYGYYGTVHAVGAATVSAKKNPSPVSDWGKGMNFT